MVDDDDDDDEEQEEEEQQVVPGCGDGQSEAILTSGIVGLSVYGPNYLRLQPEKSDCFF